MDIARQLAEWNTGLSEKPSHDAKSNQDKSSDDQPL